MSEQLSNVLIIAIPVGLVVVALAALVAQQVKVMRGRQAEELRTIERAQAAKPPPDHAPICTSGAPPDKADRSGRIMLVLIGSMAEGVSSGLLSLLANSGMAGLIGSILLIEPDERRRQRFLLTLPSLFRSKLVFVTFPSLPGGLANRPPEEVLQYIERWGPRVIKGASEVCELHLSLQNEEAALALVFVSQGGTAITGVKAVEAISRHSPMTKFYGFTAMPLDDRLRESTERVLDEYRNVGVHGFVLSDNELDSLRNDFGMQAAIFGFASASENADATVEQNNAWYLLFREQPGGLVSYSTYVRMIPGRLVEPTHPSVPLRYSVPKNSLVSAILTGLKEVHRAEYRALNLDGNSESEPRTSRFDMVLAAVPPKEFKEYEDEILLGQVLKGMDKRNYHLLFGSTAAQINPDRVLCPVVVVSLFAVRDPRETLRRLMAPASPSRLPVPRASGSNGRAPLEVGPSAAQEKNGREVKNHGDAKK